jgi:hypothetical protein
LTCCWCRRTTSSMLRTCGSPAPRRARHRSTSSASCGGCRSRKTARLVLDAQTGVDLADQMGVLPAGGAYDGPPVLAVNDRVAAIDPFRHLLRLDLLLADLDALAPCSAGHVLAGAGAPAVHTPQGPLTRTANSPRRAGRRSSSRSSRAATEAASSCCAAVAVTARVAWLGGGCGAASLGRATAASKAIVIAAWSAMDERTLHDGEQADCVAGSGASSRPNARADGTSRSRRLSRQLQCRDT